MIGCHCGAFWPGTRISHCSVCHETFSTVANFDAHRRKVKSETSKYVGRCLDPRAAGLVPVSRLRMNGKASSDVWTLPASDWRERA
jgi:hypothetical protein